MRRAIGLILLGFAGCGHPAGVQGPPIPVGVAIVMAAADIQVLPPSAAIESRASVELASTVGGMVKDLLTRQGDEGRLRPIQVGDSVTAGTVLARVSESGYAEKVSQAQVHLAEARVDAVVAKQQLGDLERLTANGVGREESLGAARLRLETALARVDAVLDQVESSRSALDAALLRAPFDAVLLERRVEEGSAVTPGDVCFMLGDTSSMKAVFRLSDSLALDLKIGGPLGITIAQAPVPSLTGRVTRVDPSSDPARGALEIEIAIPNTKRFLSAGMIASLKAAPRAKAPALVAVPRSALLQSGSDSGDDAVLVVEERDGTTIAHVRGVRLGEARGDMVGVKEGLQQGESIIVRGAALVRDGGLVKVVPPDGLDPAQVPTSDAATAPRRGTRRPPRKA